MKREIKFRAWDKVTKEYLPNIQNHINDEVFAFGHMLRNDRFIIEQYTGLKDKHGKEIYEGDIIRCSAYQREVNDIYEDDIVTVEYAEGYFEPFGYNAGWRSAVYDIEIISNIHETIKD